MLNNEWLPIPPDVSPERAGELYPVDYAALAHQAAGWAREYGINSADIDQQRVALLIIDPQVDFCLPGYPLYVSGAEEDNGRLCRFIYRNLGTLTRIFATIDTHESAQIFHPQFWLGPDGKHPAPMTSVLLDDVQAGRWRVNPAMAETLEMDKGALEAYAAHYVQELAKINRYALTIWPYHCLLGSIGHALVPAVHEALWFHNFARSSATGLEVKGRDPLTENYSIFRAEVLEGPGGKPVATRNAAFLEKLLLYDRLIVTGQAKSHCVAWTIDDLLVEINRRDPMLAQKIVLLEDCTSPVIVPGVCDYTGEADTAFARFRKAGMHIARSTDPIESWYG